MLYWKKGSTRNKKEEITKLQKEPIKLNLYYRKDRLKKPKTSLKCIQIREDMGWCNDIRYPKKYNKLLKIKKGINHEKLKEKISNMI